MANQMTAMVDEDRMTLWDRLLECQTRLTLPVELPHYYGSPEFRATPTVLDLGCGNGAYLAELARHFPAKAYRGVDSDPVHIARATERGTHRGMRFDVQDLFEVVGEFPFVLMRLVAQHLPSAENLLRHVRGILRRDGVFLDVEPSDHVRRYVPEQPRIMDLYDRFREERRRAGFDRDVGVCMAEMAPRFGLTVAREVDVVVPSTLPGHREIFVEFHRLIFALLDEEYGVGGDLEGLLDDLERWAQDETSYAQVGVHMTFYRRAE